MPWIIIGPLAGLIGVALTAAVRYLIATRSRSGRVDTTEAATLWSEAKAMRDEYRNESEMLRKEREQYRQEAVVLKEERKAEVSALRGEIATLGQESKTDREQCRKDITALKRRITKLNAEISARKPRRG